MKSDTNKLITAVSILVGTCIGAGVLGIPFVAAQSGFIVAVAYILIIGTLVLVTNLYFGQTILRTKGDHQIVGYASRYLGKTGKAIAQFAILFGIYSAIVAYMVGVGESLSFIIFKSAKYATYFGIAFGVFMSGLLWRGMKALKKYEKIGVAIILILIACIFFIYIKDVSMTNLQTFNLSNIFVPFGVILFALLSFHAIPELQIVLHKREGLMKKTLILGTLISVIAYLIFTFIIVGYKGTATPQIATLSLGTIFIILGIFTMFTSYLALGNALEDDMVYDRKYKKVKSWFISAAIPIGIFLLTKLTDFFSFTKILGIGGVISGGVMGILILIMAKKSQHHGNRIPEYNFPINWFIVGILSLIYLTGIIAELFL